MLIDLAVDVHNWVLDGGYLSLKLLETRGVGLVGHLNDPHTLLLVLQRLLMRLDCLIGLLGVLGESLPVHARLVQHFLDILSVVLLLVYHVLGHGDELLRFDLQSEHALHMLVNLCAVLILEYLQLCQALVELLEDLPLDVADLVAILRQLGELFGG